MFAKIITNRLTIIPVTSKEEERTEILGAFAGVFSGVDDGGVYNLFSLSRIAPIPKHLKKDSKEEDDWKLKNWGVRDYAFNAKWVSDDEIVFNTYFNPITPILNILAKKYPNVDFVYAYASDDIGATCGEIYVSEGYVIPVDDYDDYDKFSYEIAFSLMPDSKDKYVYNPLIGTYVFDYTEIQYELSKKGYYRGKDGETVISVESMKNALKAANSYDDSCDDLPF